MFHTLSLVSLPQIRQEGKNDEKPYGKDSDVLFALGALSSYENCDEEFLLPFKAVDDIIRKN